MNNNAYGIAPWKIDSKIERLLGGLADNSFLFRRLYVYYYRINDPKYYNKGLSLIKNNIKKYYGKTNKTQKKQFIVDMVYCLHRFGFMFDEYFQYKVYEMSTVGRKQYITDKSR